MSRSLRLERLYKRILDYELVKNKDHWKFFSARKNDFYLPIHKERREFGTYLRRKINLKFKKFLKRNDISNSILDLEKSSIENCVKNLDIYGYFKLNKLLNKEKQDLLINDILDLELTNRKNNSKTTFRNFIIQKDKNLSGTYTLIDQNLALQKKEILLLSIDPFFLNIAAKYLNTIPILTQANVLLSLPSMKKENNPSELSSNGQLFHQDNEYFSFLKIFIYLTDVGSNDGPHVYIPKTHRNQLIDNGIPFSQRVFDHKIKEIYENYKIQNVYGKSGTILFGDTHCSHKGTPLKEGYRLMLQFEYASTLYGSETPPFELDMPTINNPRVFENFNKLRSQRFKSQNKKISYFSRLKSKIVERLYLNKIFPPIIFNSKIY